MIYGRFGDTITSLRPATIADVERLTPPLDDEARVNLQNKSWVVCQHEDGIERISHLAYLRADEGLVEIMKALDGREGWSCLYCHTALRNDERCVNAACERKHQTARKRMGLS